jgi:hypothetical protein
MLEVHADAELGKVAQDQEIVSLKLLSYDSRQNGLPVRNEILLSLLFISDIRSQTVHFL